MRLFTAFSYFFKILFQGEEKALHASTLSNEKTSENLSTQTTAPVADNRPEFQISQSPAVQVLNLFQTHGRLIDFLQEDIRQFDDADIGAAVRDIHAGCRKVLDKHFEITPVIDKNDGDNINIEPQFDPSRIELVGNLLTDNVIESGVKGKLVHKGWQAVSTHLPTVADGQDDRIIAPAQVEVIS